MRKAPKSYFPHSLLRGLTAISILGMLGASCSHKDANDAATTPINTNPPVAISTNAVDTNKSSAGVKGIAAVEEVKVVKQAIAPPYHQVFVLCVGINENPAYGNLHFAVSDAAGVAHTFRKVYGFTNVTLLTNTLATSSNVLAAMSDIRSHLSPELKDDFIFYFSGHGDTWSEPSVQDGKTNVTRHGFLVAYNGATNVPASLAELQERNLEITSLASNIVQMPARHRLMFFDSCFSGLAYMNQDVVDKKPDDFDTGVINHRTVQIMTAGLASEQVVEDSNDEHGVFTAALLKQLTNDNILTMEEIFFPLRVAVRSSLQHIDGKHVMTPQLRYLIYQNGSFLFVPVDQMEAWAGAKSDNASVANAEAKGYLRPVTVAEVTNVQSDAAASPEKWNDTVDRYEARAAMGDPCATIALAKIYNDGIGVPADPDRAKAYTAESSDYANAETNFNIAGLAGIPNQMMQNLVGGLLKNFNVNDVFVIRGIPSTGNKNADLGLAIANSKPAQSGIKRVGTTISGWFSKSPVKDLASRQKKVKSWLTKPTDKNIISAKKELLLCEDDLNKLAEMWTADQRPPEFVELKKLIHDTETALDQNLTDQALTSIEKVAPAVDALQTVVKAQSAK